MKRKTTVCERENQRCWNINYRVKSKWY